MLAQVIRGVTHKGNGGDMLKDFKAFMEKGNLPQLAVAFITGIAFAAVVTSLVNDIIMPAVAVASI